jgi:pyruvyltransferase
MGSRPIRYSWAARYRRNFQSHDGKGKRTEACRKALENRKKGRNSPPAHLCYNLSMYPLFYSGSPNFGDALNPILYHYITGRDCQWVPPETQGKILACGSIGQSAMPLDIVWGSGIIAKDSQLKCGVTTQVVVSRGPLTSELFNKQTGKFCDVYGDPGLLISDYIEASKKSHKIGIVPNYVDRDIVTNDPNLKGFYIDIMSGVDNVIKQITSCELIISSALHGIICAEAYGIPAVWVEFSDGVAGGGFKFLDYYLGTKRTPQTPINWRHKRDINEATSVHWEPPIMDTDLLLSLCPFDWDVTDYKRWEAITDKWDDRNSTIGKIVDEGTSIIEFGAGNETMRDFIPKSCSYVGSDIYKRFPTTIVCDLNTNVFPDLSDFDTIIISGVLEYIYVSHIERFLEYTKVFPIKTFICSYDHIADRQHNGWVNDLSKDELINMFRDYGYNLDRDYGGIYKFIR